MDNLVEKFKVFYEDKGPSDYLSQVPYLEKIADHYQTHNDWASLIRALALYNSCAVRSPKESAHWSRKAYDVQIKYWSDEISPPSFEQHLELAGFLKSTLQEIRETYKTLVNRCEPLFSGMDCRPGRLQCEENEHLYGRILEEIPRLSQELNHDMIKFTRLVSEKAVSICGKAPCPFSVVAMGSLARGETTPYSDLEFMFLVKEENKGTKSYFEQLAVTVYFLIGNLKETKLKYMAIPELMDWSAKKQKFVAHWFDDTTMNGFKIDGLGDWAGNIPTGGGSEQQRNQYICTVEKLAERYKAVLDDPDPKESLRGDLTAMLANTIHVYGDKDLHNEFRQRIAENTPSVKRKTATTKMLQNDVTKYQLKPSTDLTHRRDVKTDVYRYPSLLILDLKILHSIDCADPWQVIDLLQQRDVLTASAANSLKFSLCCGVFMRLAAYFYHDSQKEAISVMSSDPRDLCYKGIWYVPRPLLIHMFIHLRPLTSSVADAVSGFNQSIDAEITEVSRILSAVRVSYYCRDYLSVQQQLNALYPSDGIVMAAESTQHMYIVTALEAAEYKKAEKLLIHRISSQQAVPNDYELLGRLYSMQSQYAQALEYLKLGLGVYMGKPAHSKYDHLKIASFYYEIGNVQQTQANFDGAQEHYKLALNLALKVADKKDQIAIAGLYGSIGKVLGEQGDHHGSLEFSQKALAVELKVIGDRDHTDIATCYNNIATPLKAQGDYQGALKYYTKALDMKLRIYGDSDHADVAGTYNNVSSVLEVLGDYRRACELQEKALNMRQRIAGDSDQLELAVALNNIGFLFHAQNDYHRAFEYHKKALDMRLRIFGTSSHTSLVVSYTNLGAIAYDLGRYGDALEYHKEALDMNVRLLGDIDHTNIATAYNNIGTVLLAQGDLHKASEYYKKCLDMKLKLFGDSDHDEIASSYSNMGKLRRVLGDNRGAMEYHRKALDMKLRLFGEEGHPSIALTYNNIGAVLNAQDDENGALEHFRKALEMRLKIYGSVARADTASSYNNIAVVLQAQGDYHTALEYLRKALDMYQQLFQDENHPQVARVKRNIEEVELMAQLSDSDSSAG